MNNRDVFGMSLRNLTKRKLRAFLTILGVVIGTASIVVMISLGLAINAQFDEQIKKMGDVTVVTVYGNSQGRYYGGMGMVVSMGGSSQQQKTPPELDDNMVAKFRQIPGVVTSSPIYRTNVFLKSGKYIMDWCQVIGIDPVAMQALGFETDQGRLLEPGDKFNVVFGAKSELNFYKPSMRVFYSERYYQDMQGMPVETLVDVMTERISMSYDYRFIQRDFGNVDQGTEGETDDGSGNGTPEVKPISIRTVGVLKPKDYNSDTSIYMDIQVARKLDEDKRKSEQEQQREWGYYSSSSNQKPKGYDTVLVKCTGLKTVKKVRDEIIAMGYNAEIPTQYLDSAQSTAMGLQALLGAIGAVSLLVAAIGIANTMITATYERTKEIGIMKVIGASISDIRKLFLLEAALIGFIGGTIGVGMSYLISYILNNANLTFLTAMAPSMGMQDPSAAKPSVSLITPWLSASAMTFSAVIGLVSGYFPARRAMRLSALSAIRGE